MVMVGSDKDGKPLLFKVRVYKPVRLLLGIVNVNCVEDNTVAVKSTPFNVMVVGLTKSVPVTVIV